MQVHYGEGVAIRIGPEPCVGAREGDGEASAGERIGQPLNRESKIVPSVDVFRITEGNMDGRASASACPAGRGRRPWHVWKLFSREPGGLGLGRRIASGSNAYLAAKNPWLLRQLHTPLALGDLPFVVGRAPVAGEELAPLPPDLKLDDTPPFRLSRNHLMIERRGGSYHVRDLRSTLGTIVNGEPIGTHFRTDDAPLRAGENEVIAGGVDSPFVFSVYLG